MALSKEQAARLNRGLDLLLESLNGPLVAGGSGYNPQILPYRICTMPNEKGVMFGLSHRAPIGCHHPNGQKWITYKGPSLQDCELIAQTAGTDDEMVTMFRRCIFEGVRPMRLKSGSPIDEAAINQIVTERLKVLLDAKIAEMQKRSLTPTIAPEAPATRVETPEPPPALRPRKPNKMLQTWTERVQLLGIKALRPRKPNKMLQTWTERAQLLGIKAPILAGDGSRIDGRWMRFAQEKWRKHLLMHPVQPEATQAPA